MAAFRKTCMMLLSLCATQLLLRSSSGRSSSSTSLRRVSYHAVKDHTPIDWGFKGQSYIWMFFIYGLGALLFPLVHHHLKGFQLILRIFLIALGIFVVEFVTGFILDKVTGHCPWQYTNRWNIMGYIRLDFLPAWMGFGYLIERADELFEKMSGTLID